MKKTFPYQRVLLKLSGEALMGNSQSCFTKDSLAHICSGIKDLSQKGIQVGIVVGGGNIFRGRLADELAFERTPADNMGMLATIINSIALQQYLERDGQKAQVMSAISCSGIVEKYHWEKAIAYLESGNIVIFAGGTGNPYFTTDTAAALRASEIQAQILLKATKVNGIYSDDPLKNPKAIRYDKISFSDVLAQKLDVMDATAVALCMQSGIPILVFNMCACEKYSEVLVNNSLGTFVYL